jgi:uncharacterized membrane protein
MTIGLKIGKNEMKKVIVAIIFGAILVIPIFADYVEIGTSGTLLLNRPFCGS